MKGGAPWPGRYGSRLGAGGLSIVRQTFLLQSLVGQSNLCVAAGQFPSELEAQALRMVHHSVKRLDDLIDYIHDAVTPRALPAHSKENDAQGEKLKHPAPRPVIRCWLFEVCNAFKCCFCVKLSQPFFSRQLDVELHQPAILL
jgi:hypothetical protein